MSDPIQSLISDPFAPPPDARPFGAGTVARPSSLVSDLSAPDRLTDAARRAPTQAPDTVARVFALQRKTGLPKEVIERNLDDVEQQAAAADFNPETFRASSPLLASWLASDAGHLALTQDDLQPLSGMERLLGVGRNVAGAAAAGVAGFSEGIWGAVQAAAESAATGRKPPSTLDLYAGAGPTAAPAPDYGYGPRWDEASQSYAGAPKGLGFLGPLIRPDSLPGQPVVMSEYSIGMEVDGKIIEIPTIVPTLTKAEVQAILSLKEGAPLPESIDRKARAHAAQRIAAGQDPFAGPGEQQALYPDLVRAPIPSAPVPAGLAAFAAATASIAHHLADKARGEQTGAGFIERSIYGGIESVGQMAPGLALGAVAGPGALLAVAGVTTGGQSYSQARTEGVSPNKALAFGTFQGAVEVATEFIPAHKLFKDLAEKAPFVQLLLHQMKTEVPGEIVATVLQDFGEWMALPSNKEKTAVDFLKEQPSAIAATVISTLVAVGGTTVIAQGTAHLLESLGDVANESKTLKRSPEKVEEFLTQATKDGPVETVHLPFAPAVEYWQSKGLDPAQMVASLTGDPAAYQKALTTGEDLAVPLAKYATQIAATEHNAFFASEARFDPLAMNTREEDAFRKELAAQATTVPTEPSGPTVGERIRADLVDRLVAGGQMERATAETNAAVVSSFFDTFVQGRAGQDALALFASRVGPIQRSAGPTDVTATFLAHGPGGPLYNLVGGPQHGSTVSAQQLTDQGIPVPDTPVDTGERLNGDQLRARALAVASQAGPLGQEDLSALLNQPETVRRLDRRQTQTDIPLAGLERRAPDTGFTHVASEFADLPINVMENIGAAALRMLREDPTIKTRALAMQTQAQATPRVKDLGTLFQGRRGSISFDPSGQATISLFEKADLSTFMHEMGGHLFLELYGDVVDTLSALDPGTLTPEQQRILDDYHTVILPFLGVDSREAVTRTQHEQWANAWEDYLMEGKAPSVELRSVFARMRAWLLHVYRRIGRNVTLTDAVRGVMDRMLATDDAIAAAEQDAQIVPLFVTAESAGWSPAVFAAYQKDFERAGEQARDEVQQATMKELTREREAVWQTERAQLRTEIAATVYQRKDYVALSAIQQGTTPDGTPMPGEPGPMKLSKDALVAAKVPPEAMTRLRAQRLYSAKEGLHPDVAAELFGYPSGQALVHALLTLTPMEQMIDRETDAEMTARHGDRLADGSLVDEARAAVLSVDGRAKVIAAELRALAQKAREIGPAVKAVKGEARAAVRAGRAVLRQVPSRAAIQTFAEQRIAGTTIGQLRPLLFFAAARTAAGLALDRVTAGDYDGALAAKIQHLLNLELYRAAVNAQDQIEHARDTFAKFFRPDDDLAKRRTLDLVHAARAIVAPYFFPTKTSDALDALDKVRTYDPDLYASLQDAIQVARAGGTDLKSLTVEGFIGMRDAALALWTRSRRDRQIVIDGQKRDRREVTAELTARLDEVAPSTRVERTDREMLFLDARAMLRRVESWADALDGGNPNGVFRTYLWTPISEATAKYRVAKNASLKNVLDLVQPIEASLTRDKITAPELQGHTFENFGAVLHAILHTGNDSNFQKLLRGYQWGSVQADGTVDRRGWDAFVARLIQEGTLTKAHYDFAQAVWDLNESLKPAAQAAHHDLYGHYFAEVTATPFDMPFGSYRGGYIPAMVDTLKAPDAAIRQEKGDVLDGDNSFMFPTTGRGFTKARVEAYAKPLALDLRLIPQHLDKVLRFIHIEPAVKDAGRLLRSTALRDRLNVYDPTAASKLLNPWLQRAATQRVSRPGVSSAADRFFRVVRTRTGLNIIAASVVNTLQQFTGLSIAAVKVKPRYLRNALWDYVKAPRAFAAHVSESSVFMQTLTGTQGIEIQQTIEDILLNPNPFEQVRHFASKHGYFMQSATQNLVNVVTWGGAYAQAMATGEAGQTEAQLHTSAVRQADSAVRLTQGTFAPEDVARFEAGTPMMRAFTMFASYFNMLANLLGTEFSTVARDLGLRKGAGRGLYIYTFGFMLPAVLSEVLRQAIGGWDDDDDDTHLDEAMAIFFGSQARTLAALVPFAGQVGLALANTFNDKPYDDRISTSPAISTIENAVRAPTELYTAIMEGRGTKRAIQDTLSAIGLLTGLPVQPLGRPLGYLGAVQEGTEQPADAVALARGLVTGRSQSR